MLPGVSQVALDVKGDVVDPLASCPLFVWKPLRKYVSSELWETLNNPEKPKELDALGVTQNEIKAASL